MKRMLGVILCGGDSTRMGRDKGLISEADQTAAGSARTSVGSTRTWAGSAAQKMATLGIPVAISINTRQLSRYTQLLASESPIRAGGRLIPASESLIPDDPALRLKGPLAGIVSVHLKFPTEDLFVLACDLPLMDPALLKDLYLRRQQYEAQAYLYSTDGEPEPLCGIYTAAGLALITRLYHAGRLARHSMKYALDQLTVDSQPVPEEKKQCFQNFNYPFEPHDGAAGD